MMKLLVPFALFLLASVEGSNVEGNLNLPSVEGNLRGGDLFHRDDKRVLKKDKGKDNKCKGKDCDDSDSAPAPAPTGTRPPTPPFETTSIDVCQETRHWKEEGVVPCTTNAMCEDYQTTVGTACCLATKCVCGTFEDAGEDRCGDFGGETFRKNGVTVPTITVTVQFIESVTANPTAPPTLTPTLPTPSTPSTPATAPSSPTLDNAETAFTDGTTSKTGPDVNVPDVTVPSNFYWQP